MNPVYLFLDPYLIWFYRITGFSFVDFLIGTFTLCTIATVIGEFTISVVFLINRKYISRVTEEVDRYQHLAGKAASSGNHAVYEACNDMANEAFGKSFFMQIAMSGASLWPVFFAVDWMRYRFDDIEFQLPFTDNTVGFLCIFFALYVAARLVFGKIKYKLPYFKDIGAILNNYKPSADNRMISDEATAPSNLSTGK